MMRLRRSSGLSLPAALLLAAVAGGRLGAAGQEAPLADAVQRGDRAAMLSLLRQRVDVNAAQGDGATALHWAVYRDDAETTALLIRAGAEVNAPNHYGVTSLALASTNGNAAIIWLPAGSDISSSPVPRKPPTSIYSSNCPRSMSVILICVSFSPSGEIRM